jgi:hypothetical protein
VSILYLPVTAPYKFISGKRNPDVIFNDRIPRFPQFPGMQLSPQFYMPPPRASPVASSNYFPQKKSKKTRRN